MNLFVLNLALATIWLLLSKEPNFGTFIVGFLLGFAMIAAFKPVFNDSIYIKKRFYKNSDYIRKSLCFIYFGIWFMFAFLTSNIKIAWAVMTRPNHKIQPNIFTINVTDLTTTEIVILSQCITLTPGTTTVKISDDQNILYVHAFDGEETNEERLAIENGLLKKILNFTR
jgi:multicomponent Na+:H+ antiporter subunit E